MTAFNMRLPSKAERCAQFVEAQNDYKVLHRLPRPDEIWCRSMPIEDRGSVTKIAVIDTETTGLDRNQHKIVELAVVTMTICDVRGDLLDVAPPVSWLEDPGVALTPEIEALTGLTDADLHGQSFDDRVITDVFDDIDVIVAHNAGFDAPFVKKQFPQLGHPWACSFAELDWSAHVGFGHGRSAQSLLTSVGHFPDAAHRAGPDAWAVAVLFSMLARDGRAIAAHLLDRARKPTHRLLAKRAPIAIKDSLKSAGYRWCPEQKTWWLEADPERIDHERGWLMSLCPSIQPQIERIDWFNRYAR